MEKTRRNFTPEQKVAIIREHLIEKVAISDVCDRHHLQPGQFYQWQKVFFENGAAAFANQQPSQNRAQARVQSKVATLESKLQMREEALAELMVEHVRLKKEFGEL